MPYVQAVVEASTLNYVTLSGYASTAQVKQFIQ
jgi:hypothetical protein